MLHRLKKENMARGDTEGPVLPNSDAIRHAQHKHVNRQLGILKTSDQDDIQRIYQLQFEDPYRGSINALGYNPFYVFYGLPEQISAYNQYCETVKDWSCISIDGTGSLVRKLKRDLGLTSGHIFLHCIVIHFNKTLVSVFQMLSESQETETFTYLLQRWVTLVKKKPKQCVTDGCRALLSACCKAFNHMTVKAYVEYLFLVLSGEKIFIEDKISTYLRLDVAHFTQTVCHWEATKAIQRHRIQDFFVRCVALMVDCQLIHEFKEIFMLTCIVGLHEYEDTVLDFYGDKITVADCTEKLENLMSARKINIDEYLDNLNTEGDDEVFKDAVIDEVDATDVSIIANFIDSLVCEATEILSLGSEQNPYYVPKFIDQLKRVAKEFVLWTAVGVPFVIGHASSSYSEKNFQDWKSKGLSKYSKRVGLGKLMRLHMNDLIGGTRSIASKLLQFISKGTKLPNVQAKKFGVSKREHVLNVPVKVSLDHSYSISGEKECNSTFGTIINDSDLFSQENWGGKTDQFVFGPGLNDSDLNDMKFTQNITASREDLYENINGRTDCNAEVEIDENYVDAAESEQHRFVCNQCFMIVDEFNFDNHLCTVDFAPQSTFDEYINSGSAKDIEF